MKLSDIFLKGPARLIGILAGATLVLILSVTSGFAENSAAKAAKGPKAYVGLFKDNAVAVIDTASNSVLAQIPVPAGPHGMVITPDGRWVYVSSDGDSKVSIIDTRTDTVAAAIEVGTSPHGLAITPDGRLVLAAVFGTNSVAFIDTASRTVVGRLPVGNPHNIALSPDGRTAYTAAQMKGALGLAILDIAGRSQTGFVPLDKTPRALSVSLDGKWLYFTLAGSDAVQVLDTSRNAIVNQIAVGASPHLPLATPDGKVLVVSQGPGELYILDPAAGTVSAHLAVGTLPHWIALTPDGRRAWVTNEGSNDVSLVDLRTATKTATIPVGNAPRKIAIQPAPLPAGTAALKTEIRAFAFAQDLTVAAGQAVVWTNMDAVPHTVAADDGSWASGEIDRGGSFAMTFDKPGTYGYHCGIHPFMQGTLTVKNAL